ncbi:peptidylprolyl isomerase [Sphingobacterium sp. N143]|uniref:peptidylprolyl isomerase n=1 Tax=Sphingobacterium sp. N143 TaxID=2746727 RepID=UPI0025760476|nr:peptidylprolyl isomerase [Sphingobacterium sp. N143]MDM1293538.1 peptidylprolyl isomerase [Sphingobacterium sp. N143]
MKKNIYILFLLLFVSIQASFAQGQIIDRVVATVGSGIILQSDVDMQYSQWLAQGNKPNEQFKCGVLEQLIIQKLLSQQAVIDSIDVTETEVDDNLNSRLRHMSQQAGGQERLEKFLNRSLLQYKEEMRASVFEQLKAQKMQQNIVQKVDVTPLEVKRYFESLNPDSLPYFNTEVEIGEIVMMPKLTEEEKKEQREKIEGIRKQIVDGSDFGTMARLYSQDPGSANFGGDLGFGTRDNYVKEFSAMAFKLKPGEISPIVESKFGFHIIQVLERRGEEVHTRHILMKINPGAAALERTKHKLDSIYQLVVDKKLDFYNAATNYSDAEESKFNGGMVLNPEGSSRSTVIPMDGLDKAVFTAIDPLKPGEFSKPAQFTDKTGDVGYRFNYLKTRIPPHKANLDEDFTKIKEAARQDKINRNLSKWFDEKAKTTFIDISDDFGSCEELKKWRK